MATARYRLRQIPIPTQWDHWTQRGFRDAVALARKALFVVQGWAANSSVQRARLQGGLAEALRSLEVSREEGRILRLRLEERPAQQRPFSSTAAGCKPGGYARIRLLCRSP